MSQSSDVAVTPAGGGCVRSCGQCGPIRPVRGAVTARLHYQRQHRRLRPAAGVVRSGPLRRGSGQPEDEVGGKGPTRYVARSRVRPLSLDVPSNRCPIRCIPFPPQMRLIFAIVALMSIHSSALSTLHHRAMVFLARRVRHHPSENSPNSTRVTMSRQKLRAAYSMASPSSRGIVRLATPRKSP